jgi:glutamyl-tRNA reductase
MEIKMVGIDHSMASIEERELFSFTKHKATEAMKQIMEEYPVSGCVILSTCNRTELYLSYEEDTEEAFEILCKLKNIPLGKYQKHSTSREGIEVACHLLQLACGLKSKVFGEDQIISQVKLALAEARDAQATDVVLEKLFQTAITAAKKVKSKVHLTAVSTSVIENTIDLLHKEFPILHGLRCLVIGNGEIGRLAAKRLLEEGADVTMTLRQYKTKEILLPEGCEAIDYQDRYKVMPACSIIISGTASPHHTIHFEEAYPLLNDGEKRVLIDLAVPRDISSRLSTIENIVLCNIDQLGGVETDCVNNEAVAIAMEILEEYQQEFETWFYFREYIPLIQSVGRSSAISVTKRLEKQIKKALDTNEAQEEITQAVKRSTEKVVTNLLYGLKENLSCDRWKECLEAIENASLHDNEEGKHGRE